MQSRLGQEESNVKGPMSCKGWAGPGPSHWASFLSLSEACSEMVLGDFLFFAYFRI